MDPIGSTDQANYRFVLRELVMSEEVRSKS